MTQATLDIDTEIADPHWNGTEIALWAAQAAAAIAPRLALPGPCEAALLATNDAAIAELNAEFRGKATPTNVLSWPAQSLCPTDSGGIPPPPQADPVDPVIHLGDIALAQETCLREAENQGKSLRAHATHLILHGILHLLGYDHESEQDAARMEHMETEVLGQMGFENPYA